MRSKKSRITPRTTARIMTVQALYQSEMSDADFNHLVATILSTTELFNGEKLPDHDDGFFRELLKNVLDKRDILRGKIEPYLNQDWRFERLESVMRSVLLCALYELIYDLTTPSPVVIDQYLEISKKFFSERDVAFVNGILDRMAIDIRSKTT